MKNIFKLTAIVAIAFTVSNCKKDTKAPAPEDLAPLPVTPTAGSLEIEFEGMVGADGLALGTQTYTNAAGNTFNVTTYKYYISNIKLKKADNSVWVQPNSYYLVDYSVPLSTTIDIPNVPFGNYTSIEFTIGVDSAHNAAGAGAATGALDAANGMYWGWNQGYIMAKMEGISPQYTTATHQFMFHVGGWNGANNVIKTVSPSFNGDSAMVSTSFSPKIHMFNDLLKWFQPTPIDFTTFNSNNGVIMAPGAAANTLAANYADMFSVEHIHNH